MKRYNNLFDKIVSLDNLYLADKKARRNKSSRKDIKQEMCSHIGWLKHCNGINLLKKILRYKELLVYARRFSKRKP